MFNSELHILKPVRNTVQCSTKSSVLDLLMWRFSLSVWTKVASFMDDFQICNPTRIFKTYSLPLKGVSFSNIIDNNHILFLIVINCLLFFNSFVCFEFAEKLAWSTTLVGCCGIYNTLKVVQMKRDAGCDWMKWCLLGNIYKCTFTRIQRSF